MMEQNEIFWQATIASIHCKPQ